METLQRRINETMRSKKLQQAGLYDDLKDSAKVSQTVDGKVKDSRDLALSKIADKLDASLYYLLGRTDSPSGRTDEELSQLKIDAKADRCSAASSCSLPKEKKPYKNRWSSNCPKSGIWVLPNGWILHRPK